MIDRFFRIRGLERHKKSILNLREEEDGDRERRREQRERGKKELTSPFEGELTPLVNGASELLSLCLSEESQRRRPIVGPV